MNSCIVKSVLPIFLGKILSSTVKDPKIHIQRNGPKYLNMRKIGVKEDLQNPYCSDKI